MPRLTIIVALCIGLAAAVSAYAAEGEKDTADAARELLKKHKAASAWLDSVSMRIRSEYAQHGMSAATGSFEGVVACDGERLMWTTESIVLDFDGKTRLPSASSTEVYGNTLQIGTTRLPNKPDPVVTLRPLDKQQRLHLANRSSAGFFLDGRSDALMWDRETVYTIADALAEAADLHLRPEPENIDDVPCRVIEGTTPVGRFTLWIDPSRGYHALKSFYEILPDDKMTNGKPYDRHVTSTVSDIKLERINPKDDGAEGGIWVVTAGRMEARTVDRAGKLSVGIDQSCERSEIKLKPDFKALGMFNVSLPPGTAVTVQLKPKEAPSFYYGTGTPKPASTTPSVKVKLKVKPGRYTWSATQPTPIDQADEVLKPLAK